VYVGHTVKSVTSRVEQQAQELREETQLREDFNKELQVTRDETRNLREYFNKELQATQQDITQTTQRDWKATTRDLEARLAAVDAAEVRWNYALVAISQTV
jgi:hypothetical protein